MAQVRRLVVSLKPTSCSWSTVKRFSLSRKDSCSLKDEGRVNIKQVKRAYDRLRCILACTPCPISELRHLYDMKIYLKCEFLHVTGSFKERGALNMLMKLDTEGKRKGIISASTGNHAKAMSYHAQRLKIPLTLVMPTTDPIMNVHQCRTYGAKVIIEGDHVLESLSQALGIAKQKNLKYIHRFNNPDVIAGNGTVALEILEQVPKVDAVLVPVGSGSLLAGVTAAMKALKPKCLVYGIESEKCPSLREALKKGEPTAVVAQTTVADNLAVGMVGFREFATLKPLLDKNIVVSDEWIVRAVLLMIEHQKYMVEGSGACSIAAIMANLMPELKKKNVVAILTGGNMDTTVLGRCLERGLAASGRLVKFKVTVTDRPGGGAELCRMIADIGVSIKDMIQERAWVKGDIFSVRIKLIAETRDEDHKKQLMELIQTRYRDWEFGDLQQLSEEPEKLK